MISDMELVARVTSSDDQAAFQQLVEAMKAMTGGGAPVEQAPAEGGAVPLAPEQTVV